MTTSKPPTAEDGESRTEEFHLSPIWVLVGLVAVAIGIGCGWIMSSATFLR